MLLSRPVTEVARAELLHVARSLCTPDARLERLRVEAADALSANSDPGSENLDPEPTAPLDVEISLCSLRALQTICESQSSLLLGSASNGPLFAELLAALEPATLVLAELGIVWGDEVVCVDVGLNSALGEFERRAAEGTRTDGDATTTAGSTTAATPAAEWGDEVGEEATGAARRLQCKLSALLRSVPLEVFAGDGEGGGSGSDSPRSSGGDGDGVHVAPPWSSLGHVLSRAADGAVAEGKDSLVAQLREVGAEVRDRTEIAQITPRSDRDHAQRSRPGRQPYQTHITKVEALASASGADACARLLRSAINAEAETMRRKLGRTRAEWLRSARGVRASRTARHALDRGCARVRAALHRALLAPMADAVAETSSADANARADALRSAVLSQPWWRELSDAEGRAVLDAVDTWASDATPTPPSSFAGETAHVALHAAASALRRSSRGGAPALGVGRGALRWLRACAPSARALLRRAATSHTASDAAAALGDLHRLMTGADGGDGDVSRADLGVSRAEIADASGAWAWLLLHCSPGDIPQLPRALEDTSANSSANYGVNADAVRLTRQAGETLMRAAERAQPPVWSTTDQVGASEAEEEGDGDDGGDDGGEDGGEGGGEGRSGAATELLAARSALGELNAEADALADAHGRLRRACCRSHVQQLACWVQASTQQQRRHSSVSRKQLRCRCCGCAGRCIARARARRVGRRADQFAEFAERVHVAVRRERVRRGAHRARRLRGGARNATKPSRATCSRSRSRARATWQGVRRVGGGGGEPVVVVLGVWGCAVSFSRCERGCGSGRRNRRAAVHEVRRRGRRRRRRRWGGGERRRLASDGGGPPPSAY